MFTELVRKTNCHCGCTVSTSIFYRDKWRHDSASNLDNSILDMSIQRKTTLAFLFGGGGLISVDQWFFFQKFLHEKKSYVLAFFAPGKVPVYMILMNSVVTGLNLSFREWGGDGVGWVVSIIKTPRLIIVRLGVQGR